MKKFFLSMIMATLFLCSVAFAEGAIKVGEILVYQQPSISADAYLAQNGTAQSLVSVSGGTKIFSSGNTKVQMTLPAFVDADNIRSAMDAEVLNLLDDERLASLLQNYQNSGLSSQEVLTKQAELIDIANQIRSLYRQIRMNYIYYTNSGEMVISENSNGTVGPNMAGLTNIYVLNDAYKTADSRISNVGQGTGKLLVWKNANNELVFVYNAQLFGGSQPSYSNNSGNTGNTGNIGGSPSYGNNGGVSIPYFPAATTPENIGAAGTTSGGNIQVALQDAPDLNQYAGWEFEAKDDARSAELMVIASCWGEECGAATKNFLPEKDAVLEEFRLDTGVKEYIFNVHPYYAQDTVMEYEDALALLTEYNYDKFKAKFDVEVIQQISITVTDKAGNTYEDAEATAIARQEAWLKLAAVVDIIRSRYAKIDVIAEGYNARDVYIHKNYLTDLNNTVFAQDTEGNLIGITTTEFNDVFTWHDLGGGMTDIINSVSPESRVENKRQYRLGETNFYLCESCSKCLECGKLVACGEDSETNALGLYFSKYCAEHACRFVWKWHIDPTNSGNQEEGLKCRERRSGTLDYCTDHKCQICQKAIVGVSIVDATSPVDVRATGEKDRARYSNYCVDHKCMAFSCQNAKVNSDTTATTDFASNVTSPLYCPEHNSRCNVVIDSAGRICNNPVTKAAYDQTSRMICETHLANLNNLTGNGINNNAPRMGACAQCGAFGAIYFNGTKCNACLKANFYAEAQNDLELQIAIRAAKAMAGINGNWQLNKNSTGLLVNIYDENGNVVHQNVNLATWRAQENGLYYTYKANGQTYVGYGVNCTDSALNVLARVFDDANASIIMDNDRGTDLDLSNSYVIEDAITGEKYNMATLQYNGSCILWDHWENDRGTLASSGFKNTWSGSGSAQDQINVLNNCISFNTKGGSRHTNYNTGRTVDFTVDGQAYSGKIFTSYGMGNGGDNDTYAPEEFALIEKDNRIYRVTFNVDENKNLVVAGCRPYMSNVISACDFV